MYVIEKYMVLSKPGIYSCDISNRIKYKFGKYLNNSFPNYWKFVNYVSYQKTLACRNILLNPCFVLIDSKKQTLQYL